MKLYFKILLIIFVVNESQWQYEPVFWMITGTWFVLYGIWKILKYAISVRGKANANILSDFNTDLKADNFKFEPDKRIDVMKSRENAKAVSHMALVNEKLKGK